MQSKAIVPYIPRKPKSGKKKKKVVLVEKQAPRKNPTRSKGPKGARKVRRVTLPATSGVITTNGNNAFNFRQTRGGAGLVVEAEDTFCLIKLPPNATAGFVVCKRMLSALNMGPMLTNFASCFAHYLPVRVSFTYRNATGYNERGNFMMCTFADANYDVGNEGEALDEDNVAVVAASIGNTAFPPYASAACSYRRNSGDKQTFFYTNKTTDPNLYNFGMFYFIVDVPPDNIPDTGRIYGRIYIKYSIEFWVPTLSLPATIQGEAHNTTLVPQGTVFNAATDISPNEVEVTSRVKPRPVGTNDPVTYVKGQDVLTFPGGRGSRYSVSQTVAKSPSSFFTFSRLLNDMVPVVTHFVPGLGGLMGLLRTILEVTGDAPSAQIYGATTQDPAYVDTSVAPVSDYKSTVSPSLPGFLTEVDLVELGCVRTSGRIHETHFTENDHTVLTRRKSLY